MKTANITQAVILMMLLAIAASCRTTRSGPNDNGPVVVATPSGGSLPPGQAKKIYGDQSAKRHAPGQQKKYGGVRYRYPLIIIRTPDIVISRYSDGRYYHKNSVGYFYWQGYDNRFYLDEKYISQVEYDDKDYDDWKGRGKGKDKQEEKSNGKNGKNGKKK